MNLCDIIDISSLEETISPGTQLLVGVSGGADSMALLWALVQNANYPLQVLHVNHGLRGREANNDEMFVRDFCTKNSIAFHCASVPPEVLKNLKNTTLEEALRNERHRLFEEKAMELGITHIAIGHNADDLIESFLMHLLRGTGAKGLVFRFATTHNTLTHIRPLWKTHRTKILEFCESAGVPFVTDRSNYNTRFTRNRIRHKLLPFIEHEFNPQARQALLAAAISISDMTQSNDSDDEDTFAQGTPLPIVRLLSLPPHRQSDLLYSWLNNQTETRPTNNHIMAAQELARRIDNTVVGIRISPTQQLTRYNGMLCVVNLDGGTDKDQRTQEELLVEALARRSTEENSNLILGKVDTQIAVVFEKEEFHTEITTVDNRRRPLVIRRLSTAQSHCAPKGNLVLRNRKPADSVPYSSVRLKHLFNSDKVPAYVRDFLLVLADEEGQVFAISYYPRIQKRLTIATGMRTRWEILPASDN